MQAGENRDWCRARGNSVFERQTPTELKRKSTLRILGDNHELKRFELPLEQRVNEGRDCRALGQQNQRSEQEEDEDKRHQPRPLITPEIGKQLTGDADVLCRLANHFHRICSRVGIEAPNPPATWLPLVAPFRRCSIILPAGVSILKNRVGA